MEIIYRDDDIVVCTKPRRVLSTDEPGGMPELVRLELGDGNQDIRTVHRLDRVVGGLMVLACNGRSASALSAQIRDGSFKKHYAAVAHGDTGTEGIMQDLMFRDKARRMSFVTKTPGKGVQEASLGFRQLWHRQSLSRVEVELFTGRTHQIRCQFASRGFPLVGERKYSSLDDGCEIALWSESLSFEHPASGKQMRFSVAPPEEWPWNIID